MENDAKLEAVEVRAIWEAPAVTEYDAKAEIQGLVSNAGEILFTHAS